MILDLNVAVVIIIALEVLQLVELIIISNKLAIRKAKKDEEPTQSQKKVMAKLETYDEPKTDNP
jgi:TATA-box binding protein (TBP) (component of TFIID and TFIIIB)